MSNTDCGLPPRELKKRLSDITEYTEQEDSDSSEEEEEEDSFFSSACNVSSELDALFQRPALEMSRNNSRLRKSSLQDGPLLSVSVPMPYPLPPTHEWDTNAPPRRSAEPGHVYRYDNDQDAYATWMTEAPSPRTISSIFKYACQCNNVNLIDLLLRDVGFEHLLRHCPLLNPDTVNDALLSQEDVASQIDSSSPVTRMFWAVALYGSSHVLNMLAEEYLAFVVEQCLLQKQVTSAQEAQTILNQAKQLLAHELNQSITQKNSTLLTMAAFRNDYGVISILLQHGASPHLTNSEGESPLFVAIAQNNRQALQALGASCPALNLNQVNSQGVAPILCAMESAKQYGSMEVLEYFLLHKGTDGMNDVDCSVRNVRTGLGCVAFAAKYNLCGVFELFCRLWQDPTRHPLNLDLNQVTAYGDTVLHIAAKYNRPQVISILTNCVSHDSIDFSARDSKQMTALHIAAQQGHTSVVQALVTGLSKQHLVLLDVKDASNFTPLQYAATHGHSDITKLLAGISNMGKMCPMPVALRKRTLSHGDTQVHTTVNVPTLVAAASNGHTDVVHALVNHGADVNQTDEKGRTAVSVATKAGHLEIVQLLVEKGADVKAKSRRIGIIPRQKSAKNRNHHVTDLLAENSGKK